ncbi:unnamed protein product [Penicillium nalgiovense]|nr:unnamed protein product [Penicillium nalgiovense]
MRTLVSSCLFLLSGLLGLGIERSGGGVLRDVYLVLMIAAVGLFIFRQNEGDFEALRLF